MADKKEKDPKKEGGFKKLTPAELKKLRGGIGTSCCTATTDNSGGVGCYRTSVASIARKPGAKRLTGL